MSHMTEKILAKSLSLDDVMCPVCLDVVIEPVTMSCNHELCKECYMEHFSTCDFFCPICKKRLSTWARKAIATGTLVNEQKWLRIKKEFPDLVRVRQSGKTNPVFLNRGDVVRISKPGEMNAEYHAMQEKWALETELSKRQEEEASMKLIEKIQKEEALELENARKLQQEADEKLARQISRELEMDVTPSKVNRVILRPRRSVAKVNDPDSSIQTEKKITSRSTKKRKRLPSSEF